jgi:hypothetical protein
MMLGMIIAAAQGCDIAKVEPQFEKLDIAYIILSGEKIQIRNVIEQSKKKLILSNVQ